MYCIESVATKMVFDVYLCSFLSFLWIELNSFPLEMVLMPLLALPLFHPIHVLRKNGSDAFRCSLLNTHCIHFIFTKWSLINVQKTHFLPFYELH